MNKISQFLKSIETILKIVKFQLIFKIVLTNLIEFGINIEIINLVLYLNIWDNRIRYKYKF